MINKFLDHAFHSIGFGLLCGILIICFAAFSITYSVKYLEAQVYIKAMENGYVQKSSVDNYGRVVTWVKNDQKLEK